MGMEEKSLVVRNTFRKEERLCSKQLIDLLFSGKGTSVPAFPLRVVFMTIEGDYPPISLLISVPKKRFKRAVKRNRVKRQIREAYRRNKHLLTDSLIERNLHLIMAVIWLDNEMRTTEVVEQKLVHLFRIVKERIE